MNLVWSREAQSHMWKAYEVTPAEATEAIEDGYEGINAWPANSTYRRICREAQDDD